VRARAPVQRQQLAAAAQRAAKGRRSPAQLAAERVAALNFVDDDLRRAARGVSELRKTARRGA
jgi:hypothetical protein